MQTQVTVAHGKWPLRMLALLLASSASLHSATFTAHWVGSRDGNWSDPANWNINRAPNNAGGDTYDVVWDAHPVTVTLDLPVTIRDFTFAFSGNAAGTLTGNADLTIAGNLNWINGIMSGSGLTTVNGMASLRGDFPLPFALEQRTLILNGTTTLSSRFDLMRGAKITNAVTATFNALADSSLSSFSPDEQFVNLGRLEISSGGSDFRCVHLVNWNRIDLSANRTLLLPNGLVQDAGKLRLDGGSIESLFDSVVLINGGELSGYGHVESATVNGIVSPSPRTLDLDRLILGADAQTSFAIGGTNAGVDYDRLHVLNNFRVDGALEVHFEKDFQNSIKDSDAFAIISDANISGSFTNVAFGRRLFTSDGFGSFIVQKDVHGITLTNFTAAPVAWIFSAEPAHYAFPPEVCFLDPATSLSSSSPAWPGGELVVAFASGFDPANDSLGIQNVGDGPDQIAVSAANPGGATVRFGGTEFATMKVDLVSGQLTCSFGAGASTLAIQALLQNLTFTNRAFSLDLFAHGPVVLADRMLRLTLTDSANYTATLTKVIKFPNLSGLSWSPSQVYMDFGTETNLDLVAEFRYQDIIPSLSLLFSVVPFTPSHNCPGTLQIVAASGGHVRLAANGMGQQGQCIVTYRAGGVRADADVSVGSNCFVIFLQILSYFLNISRSPAAPLHFDSAPAVAPSSTSSSTISLANFYTLQNLMNRTDEGRRLTSLYSQHTQELVGIVKTNSALARAIVRVFLDFQPLVSALLSGNGNSANVSQGMVDELNAAWDQLASAASPPLKSALETERDRFRRFQDFAGKNFSEWAKLLQIQAPTQPFIFISRPTLTDGIFSVEANYVSALEFSLWRAQDFKGWEQVQGDPPRINGYTVELTDTNPPSHQVYYQVRSSSLTVRQ